MVISVNLHVKGLCKWSVQIFFFSMSESTDLKRDSYKHWPLECMQVVLTCSLLFICVWQMLWGFFQAVSLHRNIFLTGAPVIQAQMIGPLLFVALKTDASNCSFTAAAYCHSKWWDPPLKKCYFYFNFIFIYASFLLSSCSLYAKTKPTSFKNKRCFRLNDNLGSFIYKLVQDFTRHWLVLQSDTDRQVMCCILR